MVGESLNLGNLEYLTSDKLETILKLSQRYNVSNINLSDQSLSICFVEQKAFNPFSEKPAQDPISDEEILMNPYAGMFSNTMPKKG